jgi:nicotinate phosphoribosyltransferase
VRRFRNDSSAIADMIYDERLGLGAPVTVVDPLDHTRRRTIPDGTAGEDILVPVFRKGRPVGELPGLPQIRARAQSQVALFHEGIRRFVNPHEYPVGLEKRLFDLKTELILKARGFAQQP